MPVFSLLTGGLHFPQFDGNACDAVLLNFEADKFSASEAFVELERSGIHVIIYTDRLMHPVIKKSLMRYGHCSLIVCPEKFEMEKARKQFEMNCVYYTIEAGTTVATVIQVIARLKEMFGGCVSIVQIIEYASVAF